MPQATIDPVGHAPDVNEIQATPRRELPPGESLTTRLVAIKAANNPLLEAARPLLRALADMPEQLDHERVADNSTPQGHAQNRRVEITVAE